MSSSNFMILIFIIAALSVIILGIAYKVRLNKVLKGELHDTHNPIPAPSETINGVFKFLLVLMVAWSIFILGIMLEKVNSMQSSINNLASSQRSLSIELNTLRNDFMIATSRVSDFSFEIMNTDYKAQTADVKFILRLREYSADTTITIALRNGKNVTLKLSEDGSFSGVHKMSFFEPLIGAELIFNDGGHFSTETTDLPESIIEQIFPQCMARYNQFETKSSFGKMQIVSGTMLYDINNMEDVESISLTYLTDGKEVKTTDITKEVADNKEIPFDREIIGEQDITTRLTIRTKSGYLIEDQSAICFTEASHADDQWFYKITDPSGKLVWEVSKDHSPEENLR